MVKISGGASQRAEEVFAGHAFMFGDVTQDGVERADPQAGMGRHGDTMRGGLGSLEDDMAANWWMR